MKDRNVDEGFSCVYEKEMFRCQRINSGLINTSVAKQFKKSSNRLLLVPRQFYDNPIDDRMPGFIGPLKLLMSDCLKSILNSLKLNILNFSMILGTL